MRKTVLIVLLAILVLPGYLLAQDEDNIFGVILYADGAGLSIFRQGELLKYDLYADDVIGMPLLQGDMVQTEDSSFVEIQLFPSESVIKVAENTTFEITTMDSTGGGDFQLLYGRVRAKVSTLNDYGDFQIRGRSAVAGVRGTDFGYDYVARLGGSLAPSTSVYCFEGSVEVATEDQADASVIEGQAGESIPDKSVLISANEMVDVNEKTVTSAANTTVLETNFETGAINTEITDFWKDNSFKASAVNPDEIDSVFPDLKEDLRVARDQADLAAKKRAFLDSGRSLKDFRESQELASAQQPVQREEYPVIQPVGLANLIPDIEVTAYQPNALRVSAAFFGTMGVLAETSGIIITFYGTDMGMSQSTAENYGPVLMAAGGVSLSVGIISLIADLAR